MSQQQQESELARPMWSFVTLPAGVTGSSFAEHAMRNAMIAANANNLASFIPHLFSFEMATIQMLKWAHLTEDCNRAPLKTPLRGVSVLIEALSHFLHDIRNRAVI